jgi:hypothetical protein
VAGRYVMVGFGSDQEALDFLEMLHDLPDDLGRYLLTAKRTEDKKVRLRQFNIKVAYVKDLP